MVCLCWRLLPAGHCVSLCYCSVSGLLILGCLDALDYCLLIVVFTLLCRLLRLFWMLCLLCVFLHGGCGILR